MKTSKNGFDLIKAFEGLRLLAYRCPAGVPTIGYGHTKGVTLGMTCTKEQAEAWLIEDVALCEKAVSAQSKYCWNQNEFDALVSFAFNLGVGNINKLTAGGTRSREIIASKILAYNKANGIVLSGLTRRREKERLLFISKPLEESPLKWAKCTAQTRVRFRSSASDKDLKNVIGWIYSGEGMTWNPTQDIGNWARVNYNGKDGYVSKQYIK